MLIYDILHKEKVYQIIEGNLRNLGVKYRLKKFTQKLSKPERTSSSLKKVFNTPLSLLPLDVVPLSSGGVVHVPVFVSQATYFLLKHASQEGLFRKAGSQARQKEIMARLDNGGAIGDKYSSVDIASCLKTFFRNLPEPLIPFAYHELFVRCNMLKNRRDEALLLACMVLPSYHLNTLAYLMEFLKNIASFDKQNKMGIENLARVIGPNVMPLQETTMVAMQTRLEAHLTIVKFLIENAEKIGVIPDDINEALSMDSLGSIENDLDLSDHSTFQRKKKKHRSGSLTRMFSGLKKMVGGSDLQGMRLLGSEGNLNTPASKAGKKRKVVGSADLLSSKKQQSTDKFEKIKKSRLSLERLVPKSKKEINLEVIKNSPRVLLQRNWSSASAGLDSAKKNGCSNGQILDAGVNLSSDEIIQQETVVETKHSYSTRRSLNTYFLRNDSSQPNDSEEEFVKIPKSEYEEIKSRVSAIESQISQEFQAISDDQIDIACPDSVVTVSPMSKVQNEYEKTLDQAGIDSFSSTDQLAKRLSRELKIRRSSEHRVVRSPSARKIGSVRRKSQDHPARKLHRTSTWHVADRPILRSSLKTEQIRQNLVSSANAQVKCNLKRGKPILKRSANNTPAKPEQPQPNPLFCSDETNARLTYLQEQLNTLISQTAEHTQSGAFSDEDFHFLDDEEFQQAQDPITKSSTKKSVTWKDADNYFNDQDAKMGTPVPQTGRASVAKLRTQNAGMVLAKAKLFDDPENPPRRVTIGIPRVKELKHLDQQALSPRRSRKNQSPRSNLVRNKSSLKPSVPSQKPSVPSQRPIVPSRKPSQKENLQVIFNRNMQFKRNSVAVDSNVNLFGLNSPKTPHIKKSLNVKTPRSAKALSRRPPVTMSRRTPLKAVLPITPKRQSPRVSSKSSHNR